MTRRTRRAALATIGAGAVLIATQTTGFSRGALDRETVVDVANDANAFVGLEGYSEADTYREPHDISFMNNTDEDVSIELTVGSDYVLTDSDAGINDDNWIAPGGSVAATIERDGGENALVQATIRTAGSGLTERVSRTLSLKASEPDASDSRFRIWLDADAAETVTTTERNGEQQVDAWGDRSDTTGSAVAQDETTAPTYSTGGWSTNANDAIAFEEPEYLTPTADVDLTGQRELTLFVVLAGDDAVDTSARPVSLSNPSADRTVYLDHQAEEAVVTLGDTTVRPALALRDGPLVATLVLRRDAALGDLQVDTYRDGDLQDQRGAALSLSDDDLGTLPLGVGARDDGTETFAGDVVEVLLYAGLLDADERTDVEAYLLDKWGIA
jgi:hypothetical protein